MDKTMEDATYQSRDLYESAFLYLDCVLSGIKREGSTVWFIFEEREKCSQLSQEYWSKEAVVKAKNYADAIRSLKDLIFAKKGD